MKKTLTNTPEHYIRNILRSYHTNLAMRERFKRDIEQIEADLNSRSQEAFVKMPDGTTVLKGHTHPHYDELTKELFWKEESIAILEEDIQLARHFAHVLGEEVGFDSRDYRLISAYIRNETMQDIADGFDLSRRAVDNQILKIIRKIIEISKKSCNATPI